MYYCQFKTRGPGAASQGSPVQAFDYISDGHDERDRSAYSAPELEYIARSGAGWKVELEGGPVPVVAHGSLRDLAGAELKDRWLDACQPYHDKRATTGYLSWTFSIPKELSLLAEGNRQAVREALQKAATAVLGEAFEGLEFAALSAVHTRNSSAEAHHHVHILVSKFAKDLSTGKVFSLNNAAYKRMTPAALRRIKQAWKREVDLQLERALGVKIEQSRPYGDVTVTTKEGTRLPPLTRKSRRVLDKLLAVELNSPEEGAPKRVWIGVMDERIFETCHKAPWDPATFARLHKQHAGRLEQYEKRIDTLKKAGYLDASGAITPGFRLRMAAHTGELTPELFRLRLDLQKELDRQVAAGASPVAEDASQQALLARYEAALNALRERGLPVDSALGESLAKLGKPRLDMWTAIERLESFERRIDNLGVSKADFARSVRHWESRTYPDLASILKRGFAAPEPQKLEDRELERFGKMIGQLFGGGWIPPSPPPIVMRVVSSADPVPPNRIGELFRVLAGRQAPAVERAVQTNLALVSTEAPLTTRRDRVAMASQSTAVQMFLAGAELIARHRPDLVDALGVWRDRPDELVRRVQATATGKEFALSEEEFRAATTIGRVGRLLTEEKNQVTATSGPLELLRVRAAVLGYAVPDTDRAPRVRVGECAHALEEQGLLERSGSWALAAPTFTRILREHGFVTRPRQPTKPQPHRQMETERADPAK